MASKKSKSGSLSVKKNKKKGRFSGGSVGGLSKLASTAALTALLVEQAYAKQNLQPKELQDEDLLESAEEVTADEIEEVADQTECEKNPESAEQVDASQRTRTEESNDACVAPLRTNSVASTDGNALAKPLEASLGGGTNETGTLLGAAAFAPLGIFGGVFGAAVIDAVVFADDTVRVDEIKGRTLKELMDANVSSVIIPSDVRVLTLEFGEGSLTGRSLPIFGDNNLDGALSEEEDSSVEITLTVADLAQLKELAAFNSLSGLGIDRIQLNVTTQEALNSLADNADLGSVLQALRQQGLSVTTIDLQGSTALQVTDAQANALVNNGLVFAGNDQVHLAVDAQTKNLDITLKELQKLGVDAVSVSGLNSGSDPHQLFIGLGDGAALSSSALPLLGDVNHNGVLSNAEDAALDVTLNITGQDQLQQLSGRAAGLAASGIDHIQMLVGNQSELNALLSSANSASVVGQLLGAGLTGSIDMLTSSDVHISQAQANALVDAGLHFAANDNITFDVNAGGTHLSTSLKDLQKLGVDAITLSAQDGGPAIHPLFVGLGDGAALTSGGLPMFGDANHNGVLSNAEDAALDVTLNITGQDQLQQLSGRAAGLAASGIDHIQMLVGNQSELNALLSSANSASVVGQLLGAGLTGSIDMLTSSEVHISQAQANALVDAGLHFAANDNITFDVNAGGTHLSTSLKDLQKLGVDAITLSAQDGGPAIHPLFVGLGDGAALTSGGLPMFGDVNHDGVLSNAEDAALDVTLNITSQAQLQELSGSAAGLAASGIDHIQMLVGNQSELNALLSSANSASVVGQLLGAGLTGSIDMLTSSDVHISQAQANALVDAGLHFAANDNITFDVNAGGTHLSTSLKDLQKLGVDFVHATGSNIQSISLNYGEGAALDLSGNIPHFDSALDVTLHVQNVDDLQALTAMQDQMAAIGIDHLGLLVTQDMQVFSLIENGVNLITGTEVTDQTDWNQILGTLEESGVASVNIQNDADVSLSDDLSAALYEAGMLHALPDANVVIDAGSNKLLQTSLKAMVDIGVDGVQTDHKVYVQLGMDLDEVNSLIADFVEQAPTTGLFGEGQAGVLVSEATFSQLSHQDIQTLVGKLSQLGFTEIDLLDSSHVARSVYKITDQTYAPVQVIGAVQADLEDIFSGDILHKKVT